MGAHIPIYGIFRMLMQFERWQENERENMACFEGAMWLIADIMLY